VKLLFSPHRLMSCGVVKKVAYSSFSSTCGAQPVQNTAFAQRESECRSSPGHGPPGPSHRRCRRIEGPSHRGVHEHRQGHGFLVHKGRGRGHQSTKRTPEKLWMRMRPPRICCGCGCGRRGSCGSGCGCRGVELRGGHRRGASCLCRRGTGRARAPPLLGMSYCVWRCELRATARARGERARCGPLPVVSHAAGACSSKTKLSIPHI
jgi:hypothetical protein